MIELTYKQDNRPDRCLHTGQPGIITTTRSRIECGWERKAYL